MYYLRNFDKQADAVGQKAYLPTIAIVGGVNKVGYFDGDASKDSVFTSDGDFINVGEKETRVVCTYDVTQTTGATKICSATSGFTSMEVDGVEITAVTSAYTFTSTGEHTVKYTLKDNTTIGKEPFYNCKNLTSVVIPDSVTSIGDYAFCKCSGLTSVVIPDSVTSIGVSAFFNCYSLTSVTIGSGVTTIGAKAFTSCSSLTSVVIPDSVTTINEYAFSECTSLSSVVIPDSVTSIGYNAFGFCPALTSITVDTGNTTYDSRDNCNAIIETSTNTLIKGCKNSTIPDSVTSIGDYAFNGCAGLTSVTIPSSVTYIGRQAFNYCDKLTSVDIPDSVTSIGKQAFDSTPWYESYSADTANQYDNIVYINNVAYQAISTDITSCEIKEGTVSIGDSAFEECSSLTSVTIGSGVTSIGDSAFEECSSLTSVTYTGTVAQWKAITRGTDWHYDVYTSTVTCSDGTCSLDETA